MIFRLLIKTSLDGKASQKLPTLLGKKKYRPIRYKREYIFFIFFIPPKYRPSYTNFFLNEVNIACRLN